jgi:hypothetical protein
MQTRTNKIILQHRDISLIRMLAEQFRILSREQIGELFSIGSVARLNFRLKQLSDAGYTPVLTRTQSTRNRSPGSFLQKSCFFGVPRAWW